jgi:hypothetical protein
MKKGKLTYKKLISIRRKLASFAVPIGSVPTNPFPSKAELDQWNALPRWIDAQPQHSVNKEPNLNYAPAKPIAVVCTGTVYGIMDLYGDNPYLAWARSIKYPYLIPILYKRHERTKDQP